MLSDGTQMKPYELINTERDGGGGIVYPDTAIEALNFIVSVWPQFCLAKAPMWVRHAGGEYSLEILQDDLQPLRCELDPKVFGRDFVQAGMAHLVVADKPKAKEVSDLLGIELDVEAVPSPSP